MKITKFLNIDIEPAPIEMHSNITSERNRLFWVGAIIMPTAAVNTASHITLGFKSRYRSLKDPTPFSSMLSNVLNSMTYLIYT